ncbi:MAG: hypothetical protein IKG22_08380 [Atopobiaceae bacterium]|nr:hypothetical protein [Atopobiaceae bacterium]
MLLGRFPECGAMAIGRPQVAAEMAGFDGLWKILRANQSSGKYDTLVWAGRRLESGTPDFSIPIIFLKVAIFAISAACCDSAPSVRTF